MDEKFSQDLWKDLLRAEEAAASTPVPKNKNRGADYVNHWSHPVLLERVAYLRKLAKLGDGSASETIREFPQHAAMLSVRTRDGQAEVHEEFADVFYVLDGRATLVTGGTVSGAQSVAPGEIRGDAVENGKRQELRPGDVAHIPAGVAHQMLVPHDKTFACLVMKIQQMP